jgi:hypothetical protein
MQPIVSVSFAVIYEYKGWLIDYDRRKPFGPWPLKKNLTPRARAGNEFYKRFHEFEQMNIDEQENFRIL